MDLPPAPTPPAGATAPPNANHTNTLLNLLKFKTQAPPAQRQQPTSPGSQGSGPSAPVPPPHQQQQRDVHDFQQPMSAPRILQPAPAAADPSGLLAALMRGAHDAEEPRAESQPAPQPQTSFAQQHGQPPAGSGPATGGDARFLLDLLNRPKPSQTEQPRGGDTDAPASYGQHQHQHQQSDPAAEALRNLAQMHQQSSAGNSSHGPANNFGYEQRNFDPPAYYPSAPDPPTANTGSYSYNNSYDDFSGTKSQERTPNTGHVEAMVSQPIHAPPPFHILKKPQSGASGSSRTGADHGSSGGLRSATGSPSHDRRRFGHSSSPTGPTPGTTVSYNSFPHTDRTKETVADAIGELGPQVDYEARAALARLEFQPVDTSIANNLDDILRGETENNFDSHHSRRRQDDSDNGDDDGFPNRTPPLEASGRHRPDSVQGVADSWESADQDDNLVVDDEEQQPPIQVFNFPMKPWIAITLQDDMPEERPQFSDKAMTDIARLKKDFDQMDRNLYTASENYMTYGMSSKAGGFRVIRQEDGRDAKVFTDTKDRIFNVSMSVTPSEHPVPKEAIIGTGTSGTVYWVQIKEGDKDHLDEAQAHLEQYGFALPPIPSLEGDAPGGVLKTRARASTAHPEFFAVGRGKSINIVWPSYIMRESLFKPGHDRVVDTDRLVKQCSLRINTGKAGKDFTFSQDDSVIVSLDKSGRVKFWDVRDLTAHQPNREDRPLHTMSEIREPLMTLNSTPEGEKAWPTSVLLLDKLRPYQKRCALRYMIVGLKQNHTLQLWDLSLGKPVQEFNLPHSKEADAVCSVVYHPPTGMLVIGHPTRNSIYFAHLSAPKYNLKNWSQAEYIERLAANDQSLPPPDSTAVISGVREYSFDNKGILRSLDILSNPAGSQEEGGDSSLFELYAMHSKGVACLHIRQPELGWSKENKVINPVDALEAGVVSIGKLRNIPPNVTPTETQAEDSQMRLASRPRDTAPENVPVPEDPVRNAPESLAHKVRGDNKDDDSPAASGQNLSPEKAEKKSRNKKKPAPAEASNPTGNSPRGTPAAAKATEAPRANANDSNDTNNRGSMESRLAATVGVQFEKSVKTILERLDETARVRDTEFDARQSKLLEMVSNVLNDNTQKVLESLVRDQFASSVIPAVSESTARAVADQVKSSIHNQLTHAVQREMQKTVPNAVHQAVASHEFLGAVSERVSATVSSKLQQELSGPFLTRLGPMVATVAMQNYQRMADETQQAYRAEFERLHRRMVTDSSKFDQALDKLTESLSTMVTAQAQLQGELSTLQQAMRQLQQQQQTGSMPSYAMPPQPQLHSPPHQHQSSAGNQGVPNRGPLAALGALGGTSAAAMVGGLPYGMGPNPVQQQSRGVVPGQPDDGALDRVIQQMEGAFRAGKYNDGVLTWIQSNMESEVFARYLHKVSPAFIQELSPLMLLSMAASLAMQLETGSMVREKVGWLEGVLVTFQTIVGDAEPQIREVTPRIMGVVIERCENLVVRISSTNPSEMILKSLSQMVMTAKRILDAAQGGPRRYDGGMQSHERY